MSIPVRIEIPGVVKLDNEPDGLLIDAFEHSRLSYPVNTLPLKLKLDLTQAHGIAVQLEEQGFGYGAFWCQPPTIWEALTILWCAIRRREMRTSKTPSMAPWAHPDDPYDPWTGE